MARVQERLTTNPSESAHTFYQLLSGRPNGICTNKDGNLLAVGGRNLLRIYTVEEKRFVEKQNLVVGPKRLNYSVTDVQWHPSEDNIIASAAGNGVVLLWDLNKVNESKQDHVFQQHFRFVNKLCFHPSEPALLMSCSQDGNMHCFDIRKKDVLETFNGKNDGIRDIQFHPTDKNIFCAACESGNIQLWDIRKPEHHYNLFTAHSGPVFTLNWHPEDRYWLATGGRDKTIKIWDTQLKQHPTHVIQTIAPVASIKWRPQYKHHIASCALVLDNNVTIWDIRRPFVPFAAFQEHTDVATGILWQKDPDSILSCSKDKSIYNHALVDADRPAEQAPPVALSLSPNGVMVHALPDKMLKYSFMKHSSRMRSPSLGGQPLEFKPEKSVLNLYDVSTSKFENMPLLDEVLIEVLAKEYRFYGKPFVALCEHNSKVAEKWNLLDKAYTWSILKLLYEDEEANVHNLAEPIPSPMSVNSSNMNLDTANRKLDTPESGYAHSADINNGTSSSEEDHGMHTPSSLVQNANFHRELTEFDVVFGDDDYNREFFAPEVDAEVNEFDNLPDEAIQLRHSFGEKVVQQSNYVDEEEEAIEKAFTHMPMNRFAFPKWNFGSIVKDMLHYYAEQGDIQMSVTVMLVLQNRTRGMVDVATQEEWYEGYLEILFRLRLFNIATEVIKHAPEPVNLLNQNSTTIHMQCDGCSKVIMGAKPGWYCNKCKKITQVCSICHIPVKGLFVWCQGCAHGGHLLHMKEWFLKNTFCPAGCGHKCEYS